MQKGKNKKRQEAKNREKCDRKGKWKKKDLREDISRKGNECGRR